MAPCPSRISGREIKVEVEVQTEGVKKKKNRRWLL
jgi:hypothetical protein